MKDVGHSEKVIMIINNYSNNYNNNIYIIIIYNNNNNNDNNDNNSNALYHTIIRIYCTCNIKIIPTTHVLRQPTLNCVVCVYVCLYVCVCTRLCIIRSCSYGEKCPYSFLFNTYFCASPHTSTSVD